MKSPLAALLLLGLALPAHANIEEDEATTRAYAAGYKAAFTCSAVFNAHKAEADIAAQELTGIYPLVAEIVPTLNAEVDSVNKRVSVAYSDTMPPRISQWRPYLGCVQLPVGAGPDAASLMPRVDLPADARDTAQDDGAPWTTHATVDAATGNAALDAAIDKALTDGQYGSHARSSAILIASRDSIIAERYRAGFTPVTSQRTWSVGKSIAASIIGAAEEKGILDVKAPANIPEWHLAADPRRTITLENLLQMASGLDSDRAGNRTDRVYMGGGLVTDTATENALEAIPGTRWKYANNDTLLAVRSLRASIGDDAAYLRFPFEALLGRIGMDHTLLETDWEGNFILSSQVWTTARDLARLGLLYLDDGVWDGERILPEGWARYVATPAPAQPPIPKDGPGRGYGAQWWLYSGFPGLPDDTYAALGNRGQILMVIPSKGLVMVRRGYDLAGGPGFQMHEFAADVLAALNKD